MNLKESSVLVTGAGGFIGSHLTETLVSMGANVRAFLRYTSGGYLGNLRHLQPFSDNLEIFFGDLKDPSAVRRAMNDIDCVFNLASVVSIPYSYVNPREYFDNNIYFILNILETAKELGTPGVVHISTSEVYGTAELVPIPETHPLKAQSPYSASKIGADMIAFSFNRSFNSPVTVVRPFNTYGPRQSERAVIPTIITQALTGESILLGDVRPTRDFNYVRDTVEGIIAAGVNIEKIHGEEINIGSGVEVSVEEVASLILEMTDSTARLVFDATKVRPSKSEVMRLCADSSKAQELLGWRSKTSLRDGLRMTIDSYKELHNRLGSTKGFV